MNFPMLAGKPYSFGALGRIRTSYAFDGAGRAILVTDPLGNTVATQYDGNSNAIQVTRTEVCTITTPTVASEVFISFMRYDALNRLVVTGTQGADGALAANLSVYPLWPGLPSTLFSVFGYDCRGNRVTAIDPKLNVTVSVFDGASRLIETQRQAQTYWRSKWKEYNWMM